MYPVLFHIGSFEVTSFGLMVAIGALVGLWVFRRELAARGLPERAEMAAIVGLVAGLLGGKALYIIEHLSQEPLMALLTERAGMSWFGGFAGGIAGGAALIAWRRWPLMPLLASAAPALAVGQLFGRIGCFLVGDDYGRPTSLPWGVAFPNGAPPIDVAVHPTQLYEAVFLAWLTWWLVRARARGASDARVMALYLILAGGFRFLLEFVRVNVRVAFGLTTAQFFSLAVVIAGVVIMLTARTGEPGRTTEARGYARP